MSQSANDPSGVAETPLAEGLDQLSVRFMVEGLNSSTLMDLRSWGEQAGRNSLAQIADKTTALVNALQQASEQDAEAKLKLGITELRALMESEKNGKSATAAAPYGSLADDAELVADFLVEAREHLSLIEGQMLSLERDPSAMEVIHAVFRAFHTIKGLAGFLGFSVMQAVAHEVETLLDLARNEKLRIDSPIVDIVLESADFLLSEMASIDRVLGGAVELAPADHTALIARIKALAVPAAEVVAPGAAAPVVPVSIAPPVVEAPAPIAAESTPVAKKPAAAKRPSAKTSKAKAKASASVELEVPSTEAPAIPEPVVTRQEEALIVATVPEPIVETDDFFPPKVEVKEATAPTPPPVAIELPAQVEQPKPQPAKAVEASRPTEMPKSGDAGSVRVDTAKLDHLMDMVGEMVIAQSLIRHSQILLTTTDSRLVGDLSHLARVTAEVQRATMSMRMVPVAQLFQKIERVIRDLSRKAGKQVVLQTSGTDTEVDKTVAEELSDPLLHMVRNSVDHGIEPADERVLAGKNPVATIKLAAYHQGGQVVIEISDDGRGLNAEKIRAKAEQKEIISPIAQLTEAEIHQLIFEPGFSTAEKITDVSGRGVGMDVVRRNVEKLRGRIETQSKLGSGTTFLLKLPLTLAIIDGLVVEVGKSHYIVPLSVVREIFRPLAETLFTVEGREEMVLVREQLLPIVRLNQRLGIESRVHEPSEGLLVVIESENKLYCLLVDDLLGKQEVVIKSLGETFEDAAGFSGCAVLGDGRVGLILDTDGIYRGRKR